MPLISALHRSLHLLNRSPSESQDLQITSPQSETLPHSSYSIHRVPSSENSSQNRHVIKFNEDVTDGDQSKWPSQEQTVSTHLVQGKHDWYEVLRENEGRFKKLLETVGDELAQRLGLIEEGDEPEYWILGKLPKHYIFTLHHTETASGQARLDACIFGSRATLKFRNADEIVPHLYWLLVNTSDNVVKCECKYCVLK
ncbi:hypothetical protein JCM5353_005545 [Sporobolomyces roseus]